MQAEQVGTKFNKFHILFECFQNLASNEKVYSELLIIIFFNIQPAKRQIAGYLKVLFGLFVIICYWVICYYYLCYLGSIKIALSLSLSLRKYSGNKVNVQG